MRVYLTGFMASGKSALGRALASRLGYDFLDLDASIEAAAGKSISEIFSDEGEPAFRAAEKSALLATGALEDHVIAVGGGAVVPNENMEWALTSGVVIFLDIPEEEIVRRLLRSRTRRPLVDALRKSQGELEEYVARLLKERRPSYEKAHIRVQLERATVGRNARALAQILREYLSARRRDSGD